MNVRNFYLPILLAALSCRALAADTEDIAALQRQVGDFIRTELQRDGNASADIDVNTIDPRLSLHRCDKPLTHKLQSYGNSGGHLTVRTQCQSATTHWSIYTPARVSMVSKVAIVSHNLPRGHRLSTADITLADHETSMLNAGYITDPARAAGMELKRALRQGDALREALLIQPEAIKRGDNVVVQARIGGLNVATSAEALSNGRVGEQIRVRNSKSERVVKARVVGPGRVEVIL
jgi:flagella basal body P-ring formation protein FlgA